MKQAQFDLVQHYSPSHVRTYKPCLSRVCRQMDRRLALEQRVNQDPDSWLWAQRYLMLAATKH